MWLEIQHVRNLMRGEDCVVVGAGPSAMTDHEAAKVWTDGAYGTRTYWRFPEVADQYWTIGCNRAVRRCSPDFAVCVEPSGDGVWSIIRQYAPLITFGHHDRGTPRKIVFERNLRDWLPSEADPAADRSKLRHEERKRVTPSLRLGESSFYAVAVAAWLGFERIGLLGVDHNGQRYKQASAFREETATAWGRLLPIVDSMGSSLINLNPDSELPHVRKGSWDDIRTKGGGDDSRCKQVP